MGLSVSDLCNDAQMLLFKDAAPVTLSNRELLLTEGEFCKNIWYIVSGCIKCITYRDGREVNLSFSFQGEFVTSLKSLRLNVPSTFNLQSRGASQLLVLNKDRLKDLYAESEEIRHFGHQLLEQLLIDQEEHSNIFKLNSPVERYNYVIAKNPAILEKVTFTELASYLGISRETITRIRQKN